MSQFLGLFKNKNAFNLFKSIDIRSFFIRHSQAIIIKFQEYKSIFYIRIAEKLNNFKNVIETTTGFSFPEYLEAFFLASFFLIIFKFVFRLFFHFNPVFYYNLFIYLSGFVFYFFFPDIILKINEIFIKITRPLLGTTYWSDMFYHMEPYSPEHYENKKKLYDDIFAGNIFNKAFRKFFISLVLLRLWIFKHNYLFILFNFILTSFLIVNNFLIFSSFISILLLLSRITIFITHMNKTYFFTDLNKYEKIHADDYIVPNWKNAEILVFFILYNYVRPKKHILEIRQDLKEKKKVNQMCSEMYFYEKYIQMYPNYYPEFPCTAMLCYTLREAYCQAEKREYSEKDKLIETKKYISKYNIVLSMLGMKSCMKK